MIFTKYTTYARTAPALLCAVPFLVFYYFYLSPVLSDMFNFFNNIKNIANLSFPVILVYFFSQVNRYLSKVIFQKMYFKEELYMPTTNFLLYSDKQFTDDYKNNFQKKVYNDFNIKLLNKKEESENEIIARKRIVETMSLIRKKSAKSNLLLQHNIEYGFFRNLIGGAVIAGPLSVLFIFYFHYFSYNASAIIFLIILAGVYSLLIIFSKHLMQEYGNAYAKILFQEYLSK